MSRTCDAFDAQRWLGAPGSFMCIDHWQWCSRPLQRTINARFRALRNPRDLLRDQAYLEACAKAIERGQPEGTAPTAIAACRRCSRECGLPSTKKPYIIRIWAAGLDCYLGEASDEDDDESRPPRTTDYSQA